MKICSLTKGKNGVRRVAKSCLAALMVVSGSALTADASSSANTSHTKHQPNFLESWWNGDGASGNWFGARDVLEEHGLDFGGFWKGQYFLITSKGVSNHVQSAFEEEIKFTANVDFQKLIGIPGLSGFADVRWRSGNNPNDYVGASSTFSPASLQSGQQWRMGSFFLTWVSQDLLWTKDALTISGGWQNPYYFFAQQRGSKLFQNNAPSNSKGFTPNGIPWSSSYNAWGGFVKVKTNQWHYTQAGFYMAIPQATNTSNHGLYFSGYTPDRTQNGFYFVGETGFLPKLTRAKLPGKYVFGSYYFGNPYNSFFGERYWGRFGFYWQTDQMIFREPESPSKVDTCIAADGKSVCGSATANRSFKEVKAPAKKALSEQGLYFISFFNFAPKYYANMPFYFHTGLIYQGLIPTRDRDQLGVIFALGNYSYYKLLAERERGVEVHQTNEAVVEIDYRIELNKWAYFSPFWQYIIRPNGNGIRDNGNLFGFQTRVEF